VRRKQKAVAVLSIGLNIRVDYYSIRITWRADEMTEYLFIVFPDEWTMKKWFRVLNNMETRPLLPGV